MSQLALACAGVVFGWWASTALVLFLSARARPRDLGVAIGCGLGLGAVLGAARHFAQTLTAQAEYASFACALVIWGLLELTFLTGLVTGRSHVACPPEAAGWARFRLAFDAVAYHQMAMFFGAVVLTALTWRAPNPIGTWALWVLWAMRVSAECNVFLGVRNLSVEFLPPALNHLLSYFRKRKMNVLMPFSIVGGALLSIHFARLSLRAGPSWPSAEGYALLSSLAGLAVVEHVFLIVPLPDALLWRWALRPNPAVSDHR